MRTVEEVLAKMETVHEAVRVEIGRLNTTIERLSEANGVKDEQLEALMAKLDLIQAEVEPVIDVDGAAVPHV